MFVRFRQQGRRLQASLMQTRRVSGKMQSEHIASLGSVDAEVSVRERLAFWTKLPERLARLGNRVGPDEHAKLYAALNARIPMVTAEEQRAVQEENAKGDDVERALDAAGWTPRKFRRARLRWSLSEAEFETALANTNAAEAVDKAFDREALRIIRARREVERLCLTDHERAFLRLMERDLRRPLTEQEEHLALERVRSLGMV
jgi:hypothetical protein